MNLPEHIKKERDSQVRSYGENYEHQEVHVRATATGSYEKGFDAAWELAAKEQLKLMDVGKALRREGAKQMIELLWPCVEALRKYDCAYVLAPIGMEQKHSDKCIRCIALKKAGLS